MSDGIFRFQQFEISHKNCAMKIGTDGVLLALMAAQRNTEAKIDAVEIDDLAAAEAAENFEKSAWKERLSVFDVDFLTYTSDSKYDLIVSNPPFFKTDIVAPDKRRAMARHTDSLPFERLFEKVKSLLLPGGVFALIAPVEVKEYIEFLAGESDFWIKRRVAVKPSEKKAVKRYLWEFSNCECTVDDKELCIREEGEFSMDYKNLTGNFYLYM